MVNLIAVEVRNKTKTIGARLLLSHVVTLKVKTELHRKTLKLEN